MNVNVRRIVFPLVIGLLLAPSSQPSADDLQVQVTLEECIDTALRENLNLRSTALGLRSSELSVEQARSSFDPQLNVNLNRRNSVSPNYYDYIPVSSIESKGTVFNVTVGKQLSTGADVGFGFYNTLSESNIEKEKNYTSNLGFSLTQPLLDGFGGKVNRSHIYAAQFSSDLARHDFEARAADLVAEITGLYWNLVYSRQTLDVLSISVAQAESLLAYNEMGLKLGVKTESDVLEARSELVSRRQDILSGANAIREYEDKLRRALGVTGSEQWNGEIVPADDPELEPVDADLGVALQTALENRPDYRAALVRQKERQLDVDVSRNSLLPNLDLQAGYQFNTSGKTYHENIVEFRDNDAYGWNIGLRLSCPLGNRDAEAAMERSEIALRRSVLALDDLAAQVHDELSRSIRNIELAAEQLDVAEMAVKLNEMKLLTEQKRYENNLTSSYYVLEFQRDLADARNRYNRAVIDYLLAVADYRRAKGTILADNRISILTENDMEREN